MSARKVCLLAAACGVLTIEALAQAPPDIDTLLERVGERVAQFYKRAHNIVWIEKSIAQPIDPRFSPQGFARQTESELRIEANDAQDGDDAAAPNVIRELLKVNATPSSDSETVQSRSTFPLDCSMMLSIRTVPNGRSCFGPSVQILEPILGRSLPPPGQ